jgi:hypothetical protein
MTNMDTQRIRTLGILVAVLAILALTTLFAVGSAALASASGLSAAEASAAAGALGAPVPDRTDDAIRRAFRDVLRRDPTSSELRRYRGRMLDDGWSERDVANDLRGRDDYRSYSGRSNSDVDRVIRRAYEDILHREPDQEGLRTYRRNMLNDGWTEQDLRETLRKSPEADRMRDQYADTVIRRAYQDILRRAPDSDGLRTYRRRILDDGWDEQDVRQALRKSDERRTTTDTMNRQRAEESVQRAYRSVLGREADQSGLNTYVNHMMRDRWTQADVEKALRSSNERRSATTTSRAQAEEMVKRAYRDVLGREADDSGLRSFTDHVMKDRWTEADVAKALRNSDEYRNKRR